MKNNMDKHIFFGIVFSICSVNMSGQSEPMTLEDVLQVAVQNSPRIKMSDNNVEILRTEKAKSWDIQPTEANYSFGQLNSGERKDWQLEINQSLGSLVTPFYENSLVKYKVATGEIMRKIAEKEVIAEVKHAWYALLYRQDLLKLYREQAQLYREYSRIADLYYKQGEISLLEKTMMETQSAEIINNLQIAESEAGVAIQRLQAVCFSDQRIVPADTALQKPVFHGEAYGDLYSEWYDRQVAETEAAWKTEKTRFIPEISIGYLRQDILPLKGLNAFTVGVSAPLWFRPQQAATKQARLETLNMEAYAAEQKVLLQNKQQELYSTMTRHARSLQYYEDFGIKQADLLYKTIKVQFEKSSINMVEMIQSLTTAISLKSNYLEALFRYNAAVVEFELYGSSITP